MPLYAHIKGGKILHINSEEGYALTHPSVRHLWQELPERPATEDGQPAWKEGDPAPEGMADAPYMHPVLHVGEFLACWTPQELRDLHAAEGQVGDPDADPPVKAVPQGHPDIADLSRRIRHHVHAGIGIDRNSEALQNALETMTKEKVPGAKPARTYLTPERRDQIMAAVRA